MTRQHLSAGLALASVAVLSGCGVQEETPERCIERFEKLLAESPGIDGSDPRGARFQPIFTYDVSRMDDVLRGLYGDGAGAAGGRVRLSHGRDRGALEDFYRAEVPPKGVLFANDEVTLYRVNGAPGSRDETLVAGCRGAPPKARLARIQWVALRPDTEAHSGAPPSKEGN